MPSPLISIVLPVWNGERYLAAAIESILSQTYKNFELIIVDDCSTDGTHEIAQKYAEVDVRVKLVRNEKNLRLPASLNRGFSLAEGELFTWTSDDNLLKEDCLCRLYKALVGDKADIAYSNFHSIDENGHVMSLSEVGIAERLVSQNVIGASFLYRKDVHEKNQGYDISKFLYEDYDFWVKAYLNGFKYVKLDKSLYFYRRHKGSLTSTREMPKEYAEYRYKLLNKFSNSSRNFRYEALEILLGYRRDFTFCRYLSVVLKSFIADPLKTVNFVSSCFVRKIKNNIS